eukprot:gnl/TRDRNA2_/TRDRNA2_67268_c1_seq1.p1 gnl/TRDRNA2_/TRDRNA2_67268_c1~~gnl/TRDRNA2_/TRDRNA2_67268_c1_seq1.p1  ORF type:complete len:392 (+),score=60.86 gnl/TRDRNA2_/TRDRNA2_67268_c1_seq1:70-1176(+)
MFAEEEDVVPFDFCVIAGGCNFNQCIQSGESPWFPVVHESWRTDSEVRHLDERFLEGRRRHILEEHQQLVQMNARHATVLVVGAGFMGVEWACELQHHFPQLQITVSDFLPRCLGPLPEEAAVYCEQFMKDRGIKTVYGVKYDRNNSRFWTNVGLPDKADKTYILSGVKHSNYFMPKTTLSDKGPGGGGWILNNKHLQVVSRDQELWGGGAIFAVGDCIFGCIGEPNNWEIPPIPKTGYPAEEQAVHACRNIRALDRKWYGGVPWCGSVPLPVFLGPSRLRSTWYPWGAGIFAISLGPSDGLLIVGTTETKNSGRVRNVGLVAAAQKELVETTKVAQCRGDHMLASLFWHVIHHWPINLWGRGPLIAW